MPALLPPFAPTLPRSIAAVLSGACIALAAVDGAGQAIGMPAPGKPAVLPDIVCLATGPGALPFTGPARLLSGMGSYRMPIATRVPQAQRFFDQGLVLAWAFNFAEAARSFREAARLDPQCATCLWGVAYALGPSINHDMDEAAASAAYEAVSRAQLLAHNAPPRERALIGALATRYAANPKAPRDPLDWVYADAMRTLVAQYPDDADVLTLAAEAAMDLHPHDYWKPDGKPQPWTPGIVEMLERALAKAPLHPGANHYLIHVLEYSPTPGRGLAAAERLATIAPNAGHLVHMPAHLYLRLGRYHDAVQANRAAIMADAAYLKEAGADPAYASGYLLHNYHFLWSSALMAGERDVALEAARALADGSRADAASGPRTATAQHFVALPLYTQVRFEEWPEILAAPRPVPATPYTLAAWHYARGIAYARTGDVRRARAEAVALDLEARKPGLQKLAFKNTNPLSAYVAIAAAHLRSEIAGAAGDRKAAVRYAREAFALEAKLEIDEPPAWHQPQRHALGTALLDAGRPAEAEAVYRADLGEHPENGWALAGLAVSLRAQGRTDEARAVDARLARAWAHADGKSAASPP
jgi:tetratricopeptide (TPR) repeat protein